MSISTHVLDTMRGTPAAGLTVKLDRHYWPAYELRHSGDGPWVRTALE